MKSHFWVSAYLNNCMRLEEIVEMAKARGGGRKKQTMRQRRIDVHVSVYRVAANVAFVTLVSVSSIGYGLHLVVNDKLLTGILFVLGASFFWYIFGYLWCCESGDLILQLESEGIRYEQRLIAWSDISDVEMIRPVSDSDYVRLTLNSGETVRMSDDLLTMSMDELLYHIRKRI